MKKRPQVAAGLGSAGVYIPVPAISLSGRVPVVTEALPSTPENVPEYLAEIDAEIDGLDANAVPEAAVRHYQTFERSGWTAACALRRVQDEQLFLEATFTEWIRANGLNPSTVFKMTGAAKAVRRLPESYREAAKRTSPLALYEAGIPKLVDSDPEEAGKLASKGLPRSKLVGEVRARLPEDQHVDSEPIRTFSLPIREDQYYQVMGLIHFVRFQMSEPKPSGAQIFEAIEAEFGASIREYWNKQKIADRFELSEVIAGRVRCIETDATNAEDLHSHHTIPRNLKWVGPDGTHYDGNDSPQVWLASKPHERVHHDYYVKGNWRRWLAGWMARKDLVWLRDRVGTFIAPYTLETFGR